MFPQLIQILKLKLVIFLTKLENSHCDNLKTKIVTKLRKRSCYEKEKLNLKCEEEKKKSNN